MKGMVLGIAVIGTLTASALSAQERPDSVVVTLEELEDLTRGSKRSPALAGFLAYIGTPIVGLGYADGKWGLGVGLFAAGVGGIVLAYSDEEFGNWPGECDGRCAAGATLIIGATVAGIVGSVLAAKARNKRINEVRRRRFNVMPTFTQGVGLSVGIRTN